MCATVIYLPTPTGFRVYVRYVNSAPISPAQANSYGWQLNWTALPTAANRVETKYYHFAGQRIAMKRDGILTYLHSDHLGSAVLETNASGQIVADQRYYAYGKQRDSGPVGTDHRFTGQKQDASGLVYMNARYYDPVLGQFISPDTLVPDAGLLVDYNRYGYARGNPLKFTDPSGHYSDQALMTHFGCETWSCVESFFADDGNYAAFQGWLDILMAAEDGDPVEIMIGAGNSVYILTGRFNTLDGMIVVEAPQLDARGGANSADYAWGGVWSEHQFAKMALMGVWETNHSASYRTSRAANLYDVRNLDCRHTDCVTQALDAAATGTAAVAAGCAAVGVAPCAAAAGMLSSSLSVVGTTWTAYGVISGNGTALDGAISVTTARIGMKASPNVGLVINLAQWAWDIVAAQ